MSQSVTDDSQWLGLGGLLVCTEMSPVSVGLLLIWQSPFGVDVLVQKEFIYGENSQIDNYRLSLFTLFIQVTGVIGWRETNCATPTQP